MWGHTFFTLRDMDFTTLFCWSLPTTHYNFQNEETLHKILHLHKRGKIWFFCWLTGYKENISLNTSNVRAQYIYFCVLFFSCSYLAYSEPCQKSQMEYSANIVNEWKPWTFPQKAPSKIFDRDLNGSVVNYTTTTVSC